MMKIEGRAIHSMDQIKKMSYIDSVNDGKNETHEVLL